MSNLLKETSLYRLLHIVATDFLALHLFCFNILHHGRKFHYERPHVAV